MATEPTLPAGWLDASKRYSTDYFVEAVKRAVRMPAAQATLQAWEILSEADKKMRDYVAPLLVSVAEDYMTAISDQTITTATTYRPPSRSVKLREVEFLDASGEVMDVPRLTIEALEVADWGFYLVGNSVELLNAIEIGGSTLRLYYHLRPSRLVVAAEAGVVSSVNTGTGAITLAGAISGFTGKTSFDVVRGTPPFEVMRLDVAGTYSAGTVTVAAADLPAGLGAGDFVCLPQETPAPQCAPEVWSLLVQATAVEILKQHGDAQALRDAKEDLAKMDADARVLLSARVEGEPRAWGAERNPLWDRRWSPGGGFQW